MPPPNPTWRPIKVREKVTSSGVRVRFAHDVMGAIGAPLWGPLPTGMRWRQHRADVTGFVSSPSGWTNGGFREGVLCWLSIDGRVGLSSAIPQGFWGVSIPQVLRGIQGPGYDRHARARANVLFYFIVNLSFF